MNETARETEAVTVVREMAAPASVVYDAFTDPEQLLRWMGPRRYRAIDAQVDATVGGHARITVESEDGERGSFDWEFVELVPAKKIVISFAFGGPNGETDDHRSRFTVSLEEIALGRTELTLVHDRLGQAPPGGHAGVNEGWNQAMDKLVEMFDGDKAES